MILAAAALCVTDRGRRSAYAIASARAHELWPAAKQPHFTVVCCYNSLHPSGPCKYNAANHLPTPEGLNAELAYSWLVHGGQFTHKVVSCQP